MCIKTKKIMNLIILKCTAKIKKYVSNFVSIENFCRIKYSKLYDVLIKRKLTCNLNKNGKIYIRYITLHGSFPRNRCYKEMIYFKKWNVY